MVSMGISLRPPLPLSTMPQMRKGVVEDRDGVADMVAMALAGIHVVDDDIVRSLERPAREKDERLERVVAGVIDAIENLDRTGHGEVGNHRRDNRDVRAGGGTLQRV